MGVHTHTHARERTPKLVRVCVCVCVYVEERLLKRHYETQHLISSAERANAALQVLYHGPAANTPAWQLRGGISLSLSLSLSVCVCVHKCASVSVYLSVSLRVCTVWWC